MERGKREEDEMARERGGGIILGEATSAYRVCECAAFKASTSCLCKLCMCCWFSSCSFLRSVTAALEEKKKRKTQWRKKKTKKNTLRPMWGSNPRP